MKQESRRTLHSLRLAAQSAVLREVHGNLALLLQACGVRPKLMLQEFSEHDSRQAEDFFREYTSLQFPGQREALKRALICDASLRNRALDLYCLIGFAELNGAKEASVRLYAQRSCETIALACTNVIGEEPEETTQSTAQKRKAPFLTLVSSNK